MVPRILFTMPYLSFRVGIAFAYLHSCSHISQGGNMKNMVVFRFLITTALFAAGFNASAKIIESLRMPVKIQSAFLDTRTMDVYVELMASPCDHLASPRIVQDATDPRVV